MNNKQFAAKHAATIAKAVCTADSPQARCVKEILISELPAHLERFTRALKREQEFSWRKLYEEACAKISYQNEELKAYQKILGTHPESACLDSDQMLTEMANAFLRWPLPESVACDTCATTCSSGRVGTNLLTYPEALQMMREVIYPSVSRRIEQKNRENDTAYKSLYEEHERLLAEQSDPEWAMNAAKMLNVPGVPRDHIAAVILSFAPTKTDIAACEHQNPNR